MQGRNPQALVDRKGLMEGEELPKQNRNWQKPRGSGGSSWVAQ